MVGARRRVDLERLGLADVDAHRGGEALDRRIARPCTCQSLGGSPGRAFSQTIGLGADAQLSSPSAADVLAGSARRHRQSPAGPAASWCCAALAPGARERVPALNDASPCSPRAQDRGHRPQQDPEVQPQRPTASVLQVQPTISSSVTSERPLTCHRPVSPGLTAKRANQCGG